MTKSITYTTSRKLDANLITDQLLQSISDQGIILVSKLREASLLLPDGTLNRHTIIAGFTLRPASASNMMSVSHYDREAEDRLPPRYSTRPNSTDGDDDNNRVRDAEEGRNERRSLTFVVPEPIHQHHSTRVVTTEVQPPTSYPNHIVPTPPSRISRLRTRLTRKGNRSKSMWLLRVLLT